jgi:hypothetical protein
MYFIYKKGGNISEYLITQNKVPGKKVFAKHSKILKAVDIAEIGIRQKKNIIS